ncbi:alpha/beta hydrolase-fold protein [Acinetobacter sp. VNK23]|uniref:alpha/beta hydrolase n=1 Tax=Acinetobacter thutiue TaxID=2998078 RepID=UPI00257875F6|nr:alpha/beta hydrolase-fold protein [Acinetobacter thutiue]MDM1021259.1 alpha/beta hydrolase-fold protein [Acinetobacter thutiue]
MLKRLSILTFSLMISTQLSFAQPTSTTLSSSALQVNTLTQQSFILKSKYTSHDYLIQVSIPNTETPAQGFPVLYVLDGNASFDSAANIAKSVGAGANRLGLAPVAIVAIGYPDEKTFAVEKRALDYTPKASEDVQKQAKYQYGGADQFIQFIEKELKPAINSRIKVNPQQQSLFGHSFGGLFVLYAFFTQPQSFQRYIAASPSLWFDNQVLFKQQANWLKQKPENTHAMLMTTVGTHEDKGPANSDHSQQDSFYQNFQVQRSEQFLFWNFKHPAEQHLTNLYASLPKAIMLAGCKNGKSCSALFDDTTKP